MVDWKTAVQSGSVIYTTAADGIHFVNVHMTVPIAAIIKLVDVTNQKYSEHRAIPSFHCLMVMFPIKSTPSKPLQIQLGNPSHTNRDKSTMSHVLLLS